AGAVVLPLLEVPEGGVPVRQVRRQGPPGAPLADGVQDGIEDSPAGVLRRPAAGLVGRDQGLEDGPQLVAHPGRVRGGGRHPCRFHARETTLDRSTDSRLFSPQALRSNCERSIKPFKSRFIIWWARSSSSSPLIFFFNSGSASFDRCSAANCMRFA